MIARRFILRGRVQGVGFRYFTCTRAERLGVQGWVQNLPDGNVEIHAETDQEQMEDFAQQVRSGPGMAQVVDMEVRNVPVEGHERFVIKR